MTLRAPSRRRLTIAAFVLLVPWWRAKPQALHPQSELKPIDETSMDTRRSPVSLIEDVLHERRMRGDVPGACFLSNAAADDLDGCSADILPLIEQRILKDVIQGPGQSDPTLPDGFIRVMMSYVRISTQKGINSSLDFIKNLPNGLFAKVLYPVPKALNGIESPSVASRDFVNHQLVPFLTALENHGRQEIQDSAAFALKGIADLRTRQWS